MAKTIATVTVQLIFENGWTAAEIELTKAELDANEDGAGEFLRWLADQVDTDPEVLLWDYDIIDPKAIVEGDDAADDDAEDDAFEE